MESVLRLQINILCLAVIAILSLSGDRRKSSRTGADIGIFRALLASTAAMLALDAAGWLLDGRPGRGARASLFAVDALYYAVHTVPTVFFVLYADFHIYRDERRLAKAALPLAAIAAVVALAAASSPFFGLIFTIDGSNRYVRGPAFPAFAVVQYGLMAYSLALVIRNAGRVRRRVFVALLAYPLPMLLGSVLQMIAYGLVLIWPAMTLFLVVASMNIENRRSRTDYLTGTANRRSLDEELERRVASIKPGRLLCGLLVDLDDFKSINDRLGHEAGDRALEDAASILQASVRVEDLVARMGGDEFVLLADFREARAIEELARRIEAEVGRHNAAAKRPYRLSVSIGRAACGPGEGWSAAEFLARLDADMYSRKRDKRGG